MKRKRFMRLLMAQGIQRNEAAAIARRVADYGSYSVFYARLRPWLAFRQLNAAARRTLEAAGFIVLDPSILPSSGFEYAAYIRISTAMMDECAKVCFLPDWRDSEGAMYEHGRATAREKTIFYYEDWKRLNIPEAADGE